MFGIFIIFTILFFLLWGVGGGPLGSGPRAKPGAGVRLPGTGTRGCERSCPRPHPGATGRRPLGRGEVAGDGEAGERLRGGRRRGGEVRAGAASRERAGRVGATSRGCRG